MLLRRAFAWTLYALVVTTAAELAARWFLLDEGRLQRFGSPVSEASWRLRFVLHRQRVGPAAEPLEVPHATRGWALRSGLDRLPVFEGKQLSTNSRGLRGAREYAVPKPAGTRRLLVFGDSFTFGEDVSDAETFCQRLQGLLPGTEILNFGVRGYGHDQMLLYLREEAARYQPDLVMLGYVTDDALRNLSAFRDFAKPRFVLERGELRLRDSPVPSPDEVLAGERWRSKLWDVFTILAQHAAWRRGQRQRDATELTLAILDAFFHDVRALGARPLLADLPVWDELRVADAAPLPRERALAAYCEARRLPYVRLRPMFLEHARRGGRLETRAHWGAGEHWLASEALAEFVQRELTAGSAGL